MSVTAEQNERLTRVGPGTPAGELLRRYWQPVAVITELSEQPTKLVRILAEDLVLFRDRSGNVGLLADHCAHRGASLLYGRVEERGIACAYHGWLYDTAGNCLECPAEPAGSKFHLTVKQRAYPVRAHFGLYWAYMGPLPAPQLPVVDIMATGTLTRITEIPDFQCNWLQVVENNLDGAHVHILHQDTSQSRVNIANTTRGTIDWLVSNEYWEVPFGIMRRAVYVDGTTQDDAMVFPNIRRRTNELSIRVPIDDTHTRRYTWHVEMAPAEAGERIVEHWVFSTSEDRTVPNARHPATRYRTRGVQPQDFMVMETQGAISPRQDWRMGSSDQGLALLHEILLREMERVEQGLDPKAVIRDPNAPPIDTQIGKYRVFQDRREGVRVYPRELAPAAN
jgi:5,5'-dehydrodivanillate O-demethylase